MQVRQMYFIRYFGVILALAIGFVVATGFWWSIWACRSYGSLQTG